MAFDFPSSPTLNQLYPDPPSIGQPQYRWDGNVWVANAYDQQNYVKRNGDTMTGLLALSGNPTADLHAVPRQSLPLAGHIYGLQITNNVTDSVNDIDIGPGECASTETSAFPVMMRLTSTITKRGDAAWAAGSGNGGSDGTFVAGSATSVHVFLIMNESTGDVDVILSGTINPTMPSGYTRKRRIFSTRYSPGITQMKHYGDNVLYNTNLVFHNTTMARAAAVMFCGVPVGVRVDALLTGWHNQTGPAGSIAIEFGHGDQAPFNNKVHTAWTPFTSDTIYWCIDGLTTNTSGQVWNSIILAGATIGALSFECRGYIDYRDRFGLQA